MGGDRGLSTVDRFSFQFKIKDLDMDVQGFLTLAGQDQSPLFWPGR
jgi:hypothetical protein